MNQTEDETNPVRETVADGEAALENARNRLLLATLPHVAFEGWSNAALSAGCADVDLTVEQGSMLFPDGARQIIRHWSDWSDQQLLEAISLRADFSALRVRERIAAAVRARIEVNNSWREAVRRTVSFLMLPPNAATGLTCTWRTLGAIWYACGDTATDFAFYSKRATLAGVYGATILYWLDDSSEDFAETWAFLDRRIDDVMRLPRLKGELRDMFSRMLLPLPLRRRSASGH